MDSYLRECLDRPEWHVDSMLLTALTNNISESPHRESRIEGNGYWQIVCRKHSKKDISSKTIYSS